MLAQVGSSWPRLAPRWPQVGPCWFMFAPSWPQVGPKMAPRWLQVGPMLVHVGSMMAHRHSETLWGSGTLWGNSGTLLGRSGNAVGQVRPFWGRPHRNSWRRFSQGILEPSGTFFWCVLWVEPSSCILHEGTLVFLNRRLGLAGVAAAAVVEVSV